MPEEPAVVPVNLRAGWARHQDTTPIRDLKFYAEDPKEISTEIKLGGVVMRLPDRQPAKKRSAI